MVDPERRIIFWNRAAEEMTGHKAKDVMGRCCHDTILNHIDANDAVAAGRKVLSAVARFNETRRGRGLEGIQIRICRSLPENDRRTWMRGAYLLSIRQTPSHGSEAGRLRRTAMRESMICAGRSAGWRSRHFRKEASAEGQSAPL